MNHDEELQKLRAIQQQRRGSASALPQFENSSTERQPFATYPPPTMTNQQQMLTTHHNGTNLPDHRMIQQPPPQMWPNQPPAMYQPPPTNIWQQPPTYMWNQQSYPTQYQQPTHQMNVPHQFSTSQQQQRQGYDNFGLQPSRPGSVFGDDENAHGFSSSYSANPSSSTNRRNFHQSAPLRQHQPLREENNASFRQPIGFGPPPSRRQSQYSDTQPPASAKKPIMAHDRDANCCSYTPTNINTRVLRATPAPKLGAQVHGAPSPTALVKEITFNENNFNVLLDDEQRLGPLNVSSDFFIAFKPAPTISIISKNADTFKAFYESCEDFVEWGSNVRFVTLRGVIAPTTAFLFTTALESVMHFRLSVSSFTEEIDLNEWLYKLPDLSTLFVDARPFADCSFYKNVSDIFAWISQKRVPNKSITLITSDICGPQPLRYLITKKLRNLANNHVLNFITAAPLFKPIYDVLYQQMNFETGPAVTHSYYKDLNVYTTFYFSTDDYTINLGFCRKKE